jgi:hypothetical protein
MRLDRLLIDSPATLPWQQQNAGINTVRQQPAEEHGVCQVYVKMENRFRAQVLRRCVSLPLHSLQL